MVSIKEYKIKLSCQTAEFYENLSNLLKLSTEQVIANTLSKNVENILDTLSLPENKN